MLNFFFLNSEPWHNFSSKNPEKGYIKIHDVNVLFKRIWTRKAETVTVILMKVEFWKVADESRVLKSSYSKKFGKFPENSLCLSSCCNVAGTSRATLIQKGFQ